MRRGRLVGLCAFSAFLLSCGDEKDAAPAGTSAASASGDATADAGEDSSADGSADGSGDGSGDGDGGETSGASTADGGDTGADDGTDSGSFVDEPDIPSIAMCDPLPVDDCPDGEKCTTYWDAANPSGANKCVPIMGDGQPGDECTYNADATDDCAIHMICWGGDGMDRPGICIEFCDTQMQCPDAAPCTITNDGALPMCLPVCDPLAPDCPTDWACYDDPSGGWFCDSDASGATGAHGDPCQFINGCDPGLICVDPAVVDGAACVGGSTGCCAVVCDLSAPAPCPGATEMCVSYYDDPGMAPPQFVDVGVCVIPPIPSKTDPRSGPSQPGQRAEMLGGPVTRGEAPLPEGPGVLGRQG